MRISIYVWEVIKYNLSTRLHTSITDTIDVDSNFDVHVRSIKTKVIHILILLLNQ